MTTPIYYSNQVKAANQLYELLFQQQVTTALLSAEPQAGKTGAAICLFEKIYDSENNVVNILMMGPSNRALRRQTHVRLRKSSKSFSRLVGNKVWHTGEIYVDGPTKEHLIDCLNAAIKNGERILVVWDEAHIGAGTTKKQAQWQKIPAFFDKMFGGIPGTAASKGISYLVITATPFAVDLYIDENPGADYGEVFLEAGPNYKGIRELFAARRIVPNIPRNKVPREKKAAEAQRYNKEVLDLMRSYAAQYEKDPHYLVWRATSAKDRNVFTNAATMAGLPCKQFLSAEGTIKEFQDVLNTKPTQTLVLLICQSYKEGQTLCQDHIGMWYENATPSGRSHADLLQAIGRTFGNFAPGQAPSFRVHVNLKSIQTMIDYVDACYRRDFAGKRKYPTTQTHKKVKCTTAPEREFEVYSSRQASEYGYTKREGINQGKYNTSKVSKNAHDIISDLNNGVRRQSTKGRINIVHFDAPAPGFQDSWDNNPQLHNLWAILYDTGNEVEKYNFKCTDMYNKK